jgi:hypothetical protein
MPSAKLPGRDKHKDETEYEGLHGARNDGTHETDPICGSAGLQVPEQADNRTDQKRQQKSCSCTPDRGAELHLQFMVHGASRD